MKFVVGGRNLELDNTQVTDSMRDQTPENARSYVVEVGDRLFPPKQVFASVTGWSRGTFTTYEAVRVLRRLGFQVVDEREVKNWKDEHAAQESVEDRIEQLESGLKVLQVAIASIADRLAEMIPG
jgi:hypothetical protein